MVPQTSGFCKIERFVGSTVFVDNYSSFSLVYMMRSLNSEETMAAKHAIDRFSHSHGVKIMTYRADNGRFANNVFDQDYKTQQQGLTFFSVSAHYQNRISERMIQTRTASS